jgi:hypothetical protein
MVPGQSWQKVLEIPSQTMAECLPIIPDGVRSIKQENHHPAQPDWQIRPYLQNSQSKKGWGHGSSSRVPPSKCKTLSSNPSATIKQENKKSNNQQQESLIY